MMWMALGAAFAVAPPLQGSVCEFQRSSVGPGFKLHMLDWDVPLGSVGAWGGDPVLVGNLGLLDRHPVLRVELSGGGLTIWGDVRVDEEVVLNPYRGIDDGLVYYARDARVLITGFASDKVLIWPAQISGDVRPEGLEPTAVSCADLHVGWYLDIDYETQVAREAGLDGLEEVWLKGGAKLRETPGGGRFASLGPGDYWMSARLLERQDGWARVAVVSWTGVVWRGWVKARELETSLPMTGVGGILGGLGSVGAAPQPTLRACASVLPVLHHSKEATVPIGTLAAGTPFEVLGTAPGGLVEIRPYRLWFEPAEGSSLVLPPGADQCPVSAAAAPAPSLDGLFSAPP